MPQRTSRRELVVCADIGSTYTKALAVRLGDGVVLGRGVVPTTVDTDVSIGLERARQRALAEAGLAASSALLVSSSAAGGLRLVTVGFVRSLTAEAGRQAALNAGGKVVGTFQNRLTAGDVDQIVGMAPDIVLLSGGTDGGDERVLRHNGGLLASNGWSGGRAIVAGNRNAATDVAGTMEAGGWKVHVAANVMPELGVLSLTPVQAIIREVFLTSIVHAKGLDEVVKLAAAEIQPTPLAVMRGARTLSDAGDMRCGQGLIVVDVGGATTDVVSVLTDEGLTAAKASAASSAVPEERVKRTVEADLGLRVSAPTLDDHPTLRHWLDAEYDGQETEEVLSRFRASPTVLSTTDRDRRVEFALAGFCITEALRRHAGNEEVYVPVRGRPIVRVVGRDLRTTARVVCTGGYAHHMAGETEALLNRCLDACRDSGQLVPDEAICQPDPIYGLFAVGLLADAAPEAASCLARRLGLQPATAS